MITLGVVVREVHQRQREHLMEGSKDKKGENGLLGRLEKRHRWGFLNTSWLNGTCLLAGAFLLSLPPFVLWSS